MIYKRVLKAFMTSLICFIILPGLKAEETRDVIYIWQGHPNLPNPKSTEKVLPDRGDGHIRVTNITNPSMEFFPAETIKKDAPAIILCPGGGYQLLVVSKMKEIAEWLNKNGIHAFVLKYRLPKQRAQAFQDLQRSLRLVRANAAKWNIDPERVGVLGSSAGGHLAATVSAGYEKASYKARDDRDKASAKPDFTILLYPAYLNKGDALSKGVTLSKELSPTVIFSAKNDKKYFKSSVVYSNALKDIGASVRVHFFDKGGHGFGLRPKEDSAAKWPDLCLQWLKDVRILK